MTRKVYNAGVQTRLITTLTEVVNKSYFIEYFFSLVLEKVKRKSHVTIFEEARLLANLFWRKNGQKMNEAWPYLLQVFGNKSCVDKKLDV